MKTTTSDQPKLLKVAEAAKFLQVPKSWLYEQTRRGKGSLVPCIRVGRYVRFSAAALQTWIDTGGAGAERRGGTK